MANQKRNFVLTINNPVQTDVEFYEYLQTIEHLKYFIFQREKGEKQGTEHFQLYIEFTLGKRFDTMKNLFPTAHIEERKGTKLQAKDYCSKPETRLGEVYECGEFAEERERTDITDILELIKGGATDTEILELFPSQFFRYHNRIQAMRQIYLEEKFCREFRNLEVTYIWGEAGVGKTRSVMDTYGYENVCIVIKSDYGCFDHYNGQNVIVFDEFNSSFKIEEMNRYLDGYPLKLPCRYNNKQACFNKVFILSNSPLDEQYKSIQLDNPSLWKAFKRRIHKVVHMNPKKTFEQLKILSNEECPF